MAYKQAERAAPVQPGSIRTAFMADATSPAAPQGEYVLKPHEQPLIPGSPAAEVAKIPDGSRKTLSVEHPTGEMSCVLEVNEAGDVVSAALLRTARKLMDGVVFG